MSFGLEATSSIDNRLLLDSELPNLIYAGKGLAFSYQYGWYNSTSGMCWVYRYLLPNAPSEVSLSTPTKTPIVYMYTAPGVYTHMSEHYLYTYDDGSKGWVMSYWTSVQAAPELYVFYDSTGESESTDTFGMRLYDSNSKLTYDSGWHIAMIKDIIAIHGSTGSTAQARADITKPAISYYNSTLKVEFYNGYWIYNNSMIKHSSSNLFTVTLRWTTGVLSQTPQGDPKYFYDTATKYVAVIDGADYD